MPAQFILAAQRAQLFSHSIGVTTFHYVFKGAPRLIYDHVLSLCEVIIYFNLTVVSTQLQFTRYISWCFFHHLAGESRRQEEKELGEFLWMADFILTSCELDSFADC